MNSLFINDNILYKRILFKQKGNQGKVLFKQTI